MNLTPAQIQALDDTLRGHYIATRDGARPICRCGWNAPLGATVWEWTRHRLDQLVNAINEAGDTE